MKKALSLALLALAFSANSFATEPQIAATQCKLTGEVSGIGFGFIWGGQLIKGDGVISCADDEGVQVSSVPVELLFLSGGFGFDLSIIRSMQVESTAVRVTNGPADLVGSFSVGATAGANIIENGIDFDAAVKVSKEPGLGFELALKGKDAVGLGVRLHAMTFIVAPKTN